MNYIEYFIDFKKRMNVKNIKDVVETAEAYSLDKSNTKINDLKYKIINHIERYSLSNSLEDFMCLIIEHECMASFFAKEAGKQNASEKAQLSFLKQRGITLKDLPNSKKKGKIIKGVEKTLDFTSIKFPNRFFIAKTCMGSGGSQDGTFNEVRDAVRNLYNDPQPEEVYALVDGTRFHKEAVEILKKYETDNIKITNSNIYTE